MKAKQSKAEKKIKQLQKLIERREREMARLNSMWQEDIARVKRKIKFTQFQIASIEKGEWPL
jgi:hypothetical protein